MGDEVKPSIADEPAPETTVPQVASPVTGSDPRPPVRVTVVRDSATMWRVGVAILTLASIASFAVFVLDDGGSVVFTLLMAWFASIAMEPAVGRLGNHMRRGAATGLVLFAVGVFGILFLLLFGNLLVDQLVAAVEQGPAVAATAVDWVNKHLGTNYDTQQVLAQAGITKDVLSGWAKDLAGGLLGFIGSALGAFFGAFTFILFTFYFSADAPRLRNWIAHLLTPHNQGVFTTVWNVAVEKTGGYVAARVTLAVICGTATAVFLLIIGMPYWLLLGIWTGVVAQFVPTIGTYIAIILPVLVGLLGPNPQQGVWALVFGLAYQQVENLTLEPQISAKATDVNPAVSFAAVMLGAALFGAAGALLAVPVIAMVLALFEIYAAKYELIPDLARAPGQPVPPPKPHQQRRSQRHTAWLRNLLHIGSSQ